MKTVDPRRIAYDVLLRVAEGAFADRALDAALSRQPKLDPRDRGLATELVYGVLRQRGRLDFALSRFCRKPLSRVESGVLNLLRLGAYQILLLDRVPAPAAINETVELSRRTGLERASGFVNGILRALLRGRESLPWPDAQSDPCAHLQQVLSLPDWLARRWLKELGAAESLALATALLAPGPFTVRVNTLKISRGDYLAELQRQRFAAAATRYAPEGVTLDGRGSGALPGSDEGWFQVQDEASILVARLLAPQPGERVLDACAAPGGKTTHLAALAGNDAEIHALDLHPRRLALVDEGARRLGCRGIATRPWDLSRPPTCFAPESFDRVLVDAPCSGLGVLRRNPEIRWRRTPQDIEELAGLQSTILGHAAALVRPNGVLLYSVCTFTPEETEQVVARFLADHPDFSREDLRRDVPAAWRELFDEAGALHSFPHRHHGMDAFFAVRLRKR